MSAVIIIASIFAGCTKPVDPSIASPFSIYRTKDGLIFSLGNTREHVESVINDTPISIVEFEDDIGEGKVFERVDYGYVSVDYDRSGVVLGLRTYEKGWQIANGLKVTDSSEDVKGKYPKDRMHTYKQTPDIYISYDENGNIIEFNDRSPYILRFVIEDRAVSSIFVQRNLF